MWSAFCWETCSNSVLSPAFWWETCSNPVLRSAISFKSCSTWVLSPAFCWETCSTRLFSLVFSLLAFFKSLNLEMRSSYFLTRAKDFSLCSLVCSWLLARLSVIFFISAIFWLSSFLTSWSSTFRSSFFLLSFSASWSCLLRSVFKALSMLMILVSLRISSLESISFCFHSDDLSSLVRSSLISSFSWAICSWCFLMILTFSSLSSSIAFFSFMYSSLSFRKVDGSILEIFLFDLAFEDRSFRKDLADSSRLLSSP